MQLTPEQQALLDGKEGEIMAKIVKTLVMYGEAFGAERMVPVTSTYGHTVISFGLNVMKPIYELYDTLIDAGIPEGQKFTADPKPLDPKVPSGLLALHEKNPDCVAWISIEGTVIDYPVMYRPGQKNYYLHRDFNGNHASAGALFIAENCDPDDSDNVIIYGHHMNSGKMFAALNKYKKQSFYEEHSRIVYETLHGSETYEILFAFTTPVYTGHDFAYYAFSKANSEEEYNAFISACRERALYDTGVTARYGDKLLTLSTCEYSQKNGRMVVVARRINE